MGTLHLILLGEQFCSM